MNASETNISRALIPRFQRATASAPILNLSFVWISRRNSKA